MSSPVLTITAIKKIIVVIKSIREPDSGNY